MTITALGMVAAGVQLGAGGTLGDPRDPSLANRRVVQVVVPARVTQPITSTDASASVVLAPRIRATDKTPVPAPGPQSVPAPGPGSGSGATPPGPTPPDAAGITEPITDVTGPLPDPGTEPITAVVDSTVDAADDATGGGAGEAVQTIEDLTVPVESLINSLLSL